MSTFKHLLIGLISVMVLCGTVVVLTPTTSQADVEFGGIKKIFKIIFPPCGPGTRGQQYVVSKDGYSVCDNYTGLWWQKTPGEPPDVYCGNNVRCSWQQAMDYCTSLNLNGKHKKKHWRLPEIKELISLMDYSVRPQATALNEGPFNNVQQGDHWSATEVVDSPELAWRAGFRAGSVGGSFRKNQLHAWCVSGDKDAH